MALKSFSFLGLEPLSTAHSHSDENSVVDVSVSHFSLSLLELPIPPPTSSLSANDFALYFTETLETIQFSSVAQSCPTFCKPMDCSMPGLPVHRQLLKFTQSHVH